MDFRFKPYLLHRTLRLTPQKNRLIEKINRTLIEKVKCMLIQSKFPQSIGRNLMRSTYPVNLSPSLTIGFKTPFKMWASKLASYENFRACVVLLMLV